MRNIIAVMDAILNAIPDDFTNKKNLQYDFESIKSSVPYTAPEVIHLRWNDVAGALWFNLGDPDGTPWKITVSKIFADEINFEDYLPGTDGEI
jgi:hypothetical protein